MRISAAVATIVTAVAVFAPHIGADAKLDTFHGCTLSGRATNNVQTRLNPLKNRHAFPKAEEVLELTLDKLLNSKKMDLDDGKAAQIEGFITRVKKGGVESCNCGTTDPVYMDTHIYVNKTAIFDAKTAVIVEVTPRLREEMRDTADWSTDTLIKLLPEGTKAKITGWLFYDEEHENAAANIDRTRLHNWRGTCWELHPVTSIEVEDAEQLPARKPLTTPATTNPKREPQPHG